MQFTPFESRRKQYQKQTVKQHSRILSLKLQRLPSKMVETRAKHLVNAKTAPNAPMQKCLPKNTNCKHQIVKRAIPRKSLPFNEDSLGSKPCQKR